MPESISLISDTSICHRHRSSLFPSLYECLNRSYFQIGLTFIQGSCLIDDKIKFVLNFLEDAYDPYLEMLFSFSECVTVASCHNISFKFGYCPLRDRTMSHHVKQGGKHTVTTIHPLLDVRRCRYPALPLHA